MLLLTQLKCQSIYSGGPNLKTRSQPHIINIRGAIMMSEMAGGRPFLWAPAL